MFVNIEDITPIDCGTPVKGLQPAVIEVARLAPMHRLYCPVLIDQSAGIAMIPIPQRLPLPVAFQAAVEMGREIGA